MMDFEGKVDRMSTVRKLSPSFPSRYIWVLLYEHYYLITVAYHFFVRHVVFPVLHKGSIINFFELNFISFTLLTTE